MTGYCLLDDPCPVSPARMFDIELEIEAEAKRRAKIKRLQAQVDKLVAENRRLRVRLDSALEQLAELRQSQK